ncbi:MAG: TetR/AcrR family transcriptional regulator [Bacillota bacterium]
MNKRRLEGEKTKRLIIDKAKLLFSRKGYAATSIEDICAAVGCSKGSIYYHFKNKEDLFLNLAEQSFKEWWEGWEAISSQCKSVTEKLYAYGDYTVDNFQKPMNNVGEEFFEKVGVDSESGKKLFAVINHFMEGLERLMSEGIARGEFKNADPKELAFFFATFHIGLSHGFPMGTDREIIRTQYRKATTLFLQGIGTREET